VTFRFNDKNNSHNLKVSLNLIVKRTYGIACILSTFLLHYWNNIWFNMK